MTDQSAAFDGELDADPENPASPDAEIPELEQPVVINGDGDVNTVLPLDLGVTVVVPLFPLPYPPHQVGDVLDVFWGDVGQIATHTLTSADQADGGVRVAMPWPLIADGGSGVVSVWYTLTSGEEGGGSRRSVNAEVSVELPDEG